MHDSNHTDDFDRYLREEVSEHRMYPSDRVWKNIRNQVQKPKKWPALSVFSVLIIAGLVIGTVLNKPLPDTVTQNFVYSLQTPANTSRPLADAAKSTQPAGKAEGQYAESNYSINEITSHTIIAAVEKIKHQDEALKIHLGGLRLVPVADHLTAPVTGGVTVAAVPTQSSKDVQPVPAVYEPAPSETAFTSFRNIDNYLFDITSRLRSILNSDPLSGSKSGGVAFYSAAKNPTYPSFNIPVSANQRELLPSLNKLGKSSSNFDFRVYLTPSVGYRRLSGEDTKNTADADNAGASLESDNRIDPSEAINHNPAFSYETGVGLGYRLNKRFSLVGGLQFNITQYKINAFSYKDEPTAVTLNEGIYTSTVSSVSSLRSMSGNAPLTIKNRYYQVSMPLGAEWLIYNRGNFSWGVGASVQPTYTFDKQPLIISSNYKNYTDGSAYVRNWNVNANAETFVGYSMGTYRWQVGPQFRYQMLPSLVNKYPNKEYLFNYGLKLGVVKQLK